MANYHAHIKNFSRGKGECATAAAAYRAGIDILDSRTRVHHVYSKRRGVISHHMLAPAGAPVWCNDPSVFFDAAENWESRANAIVARELEVSLPHELSPQQREALALNLGQLLVDRYRVVVLAALHAPSGEGDGRNFHVHLLMSARTVGVEGFGQRAAAELDARGGRGAEEIRVVREQVSVVINQALRQAGVDQAVDHRTLKLQAETAFAAGDLAKAAALTRQPTRHMGKAITAALRRGLRDPLLAKVGISELPAERAMRQAELLFAGQGRLQATPGSHGPEAARAERMREQARKEEAAPAQDESISASVGASARVPSPLAIRLAKVTRLAASQGNDAAVLNEEAMLIEQWLEAQQEAARSALEVLESIPGIRIEAEFRRAMDTASRKRTGVYGRKRFLYEDSEILTTAMKGYAGAVHQPITNQDQLRRAQARVSEVKSLSGIERLQQMSGAQRALAKARRGVSKGAQIVLERRIDEARAVMVAATDAIERDYYVTPLDRVETSPPYPYMAAMGSERNSDSNRVQLKPRSRPLG